MDRVNDVGSVGRAGQVVRQLQKVREFLLVVNLQVSSSYVNSSFVRTRVARCNVGGVLS